MSTICWIVFSLIVSEVLTKSYRPVVLMHGVLSAASNMSDLVDWIHESYPDMYVVAMEIGNGFDDSVLLPMNTQVDIFCQQIRMDEKLVQGFNLLGVSQGGLIVRAAVERCSLPVYNLITLVGPNEGVFGVPDLQMLPEKYRELISKYAYEDFVQSSISISGYWRDPYQLDKYLERCQFLPDINNEKSNVNETYRLNMLKLNSFIMVYSDNDDVVSPPQSGWFLGYEKDSLNSESFNQSRQYTEDLIGLSTLMKQGKLYQYTSHVKHRQAAHQPNKDFLLENIFPFLNNFIQ